MKKKELEARQAELRSRHTSSKEPEARCEHKNPDLFKEQHYTIPELSKKWKKHGSTLRKWFENEPDIIREGGDETLRKRQYYTYSIPESVAARVHSQKCKRRKRSD